MNQQRLDEIYELLHLAGRGSPVEPSEYAAIFKGIRDLCVFAQATIDGREGQDGLD